MKTMDKKRRKISFGEEILGYKNKLYAAQNFLNFLKSEQLSFLHLPQLF